MGRTVAERREHSAKKGGTQQKRGHTAKKVARGKGGNGKGGNKKIINYGKFLCTVI